jgi:hypothetical protein
MEGIMPEPNSCVLHSCQSVCHHLDFDGTHVAKFSNVVIGAG